MVKLQGKVDILVITETKTDSTFPLHQFAIQDYSKPYGSRTIASEENRPQP